MAQRGNRTPTAIIMGSACAATTQQQSRPSSIADALISPLASSHVPAARESPSGATPLGPAPPRSNRLRFPQRQGKLKAEEGGWRWS
ncbi:hypothetical protein GQ53DRAFT_748381 [Thozetella sp. PMI_491]|nr:hypothetical protein GQ53DRAFT_748381 [Thozetella sp. PMI_491]